MVEENLIREFIAEAEEHVFTLEPNLLRLEKEPYNRELIDEIFLATHNIKGTASYVGLSHISHFTHSLESLLDLLKKGTIQVSSGLIDALLQGVDMLQLLIRHVTLGQPIPDTTAITQILAQWQQVENAKPENVSASSAEQHATLSDQRQSTADLAISFRDMGRLDPEDVEVFSDIAEQQLEFMEFSLEKARASLSKDDDMARQEAEDAFTGIRQAFQNILSSAAILELGALDDMLAAHQHILAVNETPEPHHIEGISGIIHLLRDVTALLGSHSSGGEREDTSQQSLQTSAMPTSSSPVVKAIQGHTLRVEAERVDFLLNLVGELVIGRARLTQIGQEIRSIYESVRSGSLDVNDSSSGSGQRKKMIRVFKRLKEHFDEVHQKLGHLTNQMQEGTMRMRMVPIDQVVNRFPRMVRDLSRQAGKEVEVHIDGAETELDKTVIDMLGEPLIHIIRNAVDHGIEMPDVREDVGKSRCGTIAISAHHEGNQVIIEIEDDGKGIDVRNVREKALQQQLITRQEAESCSQDDILRLIFHGGFSTVETVSSLSGRGVGLNVVKRYLEKINGSIELQSSPGAGCTFIIRLPLTLAIIPALMIRVKTEIFAIPLTSVEEAIRIAPQEVMTIESHEVIRLRERMVSLFDLADLFGTTVFAKTSSSCIFDDETITSEYETEEQMYAVIVSDGFQEVGVLVDAFLGESDIVIKPLTDDLVSVDGISGASIRGDGQISLVIDPASLITLATQHIRTNHHTRSNTF